MGKTVVTGANRGIGLALCEVLRDRGHDVIAAVRHGSPELAALGVRVEEGLDLGDSGSVLRFGERLAGTDVDLLLQNAGVARMTPLESPDPEGMELSFRVNAIGPLLLTQALLPCLHRGSKIALMTSRMGSIEDNGSGGYYGYRMSKAALNMLGKSLSIDLAPRGIAVGILHPGMVATDMLDDFTGGGGHFPPGTVQPSDVAGKLVDRIDALDMAKTGTFWHASGEVLPW